MNRSVGKDRGCDGYQGFYISRNIRLGSKTAVLWRCRRLIGVKSVRAKMDWLDEKFFLRRVLLPENRRRIAGVIHRTGWLANDATSRCFLAGEESAEEYRSRGRGVSGTHTNDHSFHRDAYAFAPRLRLNRLMPTENRSYAPRTHRTRALYSSKRIWVAGGGGSTTTWLLSKNPPAKRVNFSPRVCSRSDSRGNRQRVDEGWIELSSSLLLRDVQTGWRLAYQRISVGSSFEPASKVSSIGQQR